MARSNPAVICLFAASFMFVSWLLRKCGEVAAISLSWDVVQQTLGGTASIPSDGDNDDAAATPRHVGKVMKSKNKMK